MMLTFIAFAAWCIAGSVRVKHAESILQANWNELSKDTQEKVSKFKMYHFFLGVGLMMIATMELITVLQAVAQAAGQQ